MNNDILSTINKILSDEENTKLISGLVSSLNKGGNENNKSESITVKDTSNGKKSDEIQKKIDVLTSIMPLFEEKKKVKIEKIINALKIIKMMLSIT